MASALSSNRRVLSEKSTNASLNIQELSEGIKGGGQLVNTAQRTPVTSPHRPGTKRRFHELEWSSQDADGWQQRAHAKACPEYASKPEIEETDEESTGLMSSMIESTASASLGASTSTVLTSFHASQEPSQLTDEQFEIVQEESQRTLEQIHAMPIPEPNLSLLQPERPTLSTELSQDSVHMSSFIDFDEPDQSMSDKVDEDVEMMVPLQPMPSVEGDLKTKQLLEKATVLRTRLALAMHKVQTNQTSKPFSRLDKPTSTSPELSLPPRLFAASVLPPKPVDRTGIRNSPESQIAANRARAFRGAYQIKPVQRLNTLPMPRIVPTAYSARYMAQPYAQQRVSHRSDTDLSSSPPASHEMKAFVKTQESEKTRSTPNPQKVMSTEAPWPKTPRHQLSHPPGNDDDDVMTAASKVDATSRSALTSSVVKGEAANGLLELMRAAS